MTFLKIFSRGPKIQDAKDAESEEMYSDAYQIYASIIVKRAKEFRTPETKNFKSAEEFGEWLGDVIAQFLLHLLNRPSNTDCQLSYSKLRELEPQLTFLENKFMSDGSASPALDEYLSICRALISSDQNLLPKKIADAAKDAYEQKMSFVGIMGNTMAAEGVLYSLKPDVVVPFTLNAGSYGVSTFLLPPGEWVIVARCNITLSESFEPQDKGYFVGNNIKGRYAATFITIPDTPSLMYFRFAIWNSHTESYI